MLASVWHNCDLFVECFRHGRRLAQDCIPSAMFAFSKPHTVSLFFCPSGCVCSFTLVTQHPRPDNFFYFWLLLLQPLGFFDLPHISTIHCYLGHGYTQGPSQAQSQSRADAPVPCSYPYEDGNTDNGDEYVYDENDLAMHFLKRYIIIFARTLYSPDAERFWGMGEALGKGFTSGRWMEHTLVGEGFLLSAEASHEGFVLGRLGWLWGRRRGV